MHVYTCEFMALRDEVVGLGRQVAELTKACRDTEQLARYNVGLEYARTLSAPPPVFSSAAGVARFVDSARSVARSRSARRPRHLRAVGGGEDR